MKSEFVLHNELLWITQRIWKNYDYFVIEFGYIEKDIYLCEVVGILVANLGDIWDRF